MYGMVMRAGVATLALSVGSAVAAKCEDHCVDTVGATGAICHNGIRYNNWCLANCDGVWGQDEGVPNNKCPTTDFERKMVRRTIEEGSPEGLVSAATCDELIAANSGFAYRHGHEEVCSVDMIAGQCWRNTLNKTEAESICMAFGARLCSYHELNTNVAAVIDDPCRLDTQFSYCWTNDQDDSCRDSEAVLSRCRHFDGNQKMCAPAGFAGSLKCCADRGEVFQGREDNGIAADEATCEVHTCGQVCADEPGCGWNTKLMKCTPCDKPEGCTSKKELTMGDCPGQDRADEIAERCAQYTCGAACATDIQCGWNSKSNTCVPGAKTNNNELFMGDCGGSFDGLPPAQYCKQALCGATCRNLQGCGWAKGRNMCLPGKSTSNKELTMGLCTEDDLVESGIDTCNQYECGIDCANAPGCGWSASRQECKNGLATSEREYRMGTCQRGSTCGLLQCAQECAAQEGCGWSVPQNRCRAGGKTSKLILAANPCSDWSDEPTTTTPAPTAPTTAPTARPTIFVADIAECQDDEGWTDKNGNDCKDYDRNAWCAQGRNENMGMQGQNWHSGDNFADFANSDGVDAGQACCVCGGGSTLETAPPSTAAPVTAAPTNNPTMSPTKEPTYMPTNEPGQCHDWWADKTFVDSDGDTCETYAQWCQDGTYLPGAWAQGETFETYTNSDGVHAGMACCICGGGSESSINFPTDSPTPAPATAAPTFQPTAAPATSAPVTQPPSPSGFAPMDSENVCSPWNHQLANKQLWGSGRTYQECEDKCRSTDTCRFMLYQPGNGFCRLFSNCDENGRVPASWGGTVYQRNF
eukprot:m.173501 g.173501  ORF g.173501 m.173501 type:complete len:811 (+) comp13703_c0_seq1:55-2487(+)